MNKLLLALFLLFACVHMQSHVAEATVAADESRDVYTGDAKTVAFVYNFKVLDKTHIKVQVAGVTKVVDTDYTVGGVGDSAGGTITFGTAPADQAQVLILRSQPVAQSTNYIANSSYNALTVMRDLDRQAMIDQMQEEKHKRAIKLPETSPLSDVNLPDPNVTANRGKYVFIKSDGSGLEASAGTGGTASGLDCPTPCVSGSEMTGFTSGSVLFAHTDGTVSEDNTNFKWQNTNKQLLIGGHPSPLGSRIDIYKNITLPTIVEPIFRSIVECKGDNATFIGCSGGYFQARDRSDVTGSNKGVLYALQASVVPIVARNNVPFDDVGGVIVQNDGTAKGTDAIYIGRNAAIAGSEWIHAIAVDANAESMLEAAGTYSDAGINLNLATITSGVGFRVKNNVGLYGRTVANDADILIAKVNAAEAIEISDTARATQLNGDLWTDADNQRDIGTTAKRFKKSYIAIGEFGLAPSAHNGILGGKQAANNTDTLFLQRNTDSAPTGSLIRLVNAANNVDLFKVGVDGVVSATGGLATFTGTKTVRASGGAADCDLAFSGGILVTTGTTC